MPDDVVAAQIVMFWGHLVEIIGVTSYKMVKACKYTFLYSVCVDSTHA